MGREEGTSVRQEGRRCYSCRLCESCLGNFPDRKPGEGRLGVGLAPVRLWLGILVVLVGRLFSLCVVSIAAQHHLTLPSLIELGKEWPETWHPSSLSLDGCR